MKNKLSDLNNHLFAQIERLGDEDLTQEEVNTECKRALSIVAVSEQIIGNASLTLKAAKLVADHGVGVKKYLPIIEAKVE